jgi:hypothetical protein
LVFAHIGRPTIRARDAGSRLPYGEWGDDGRRYRLVTHPGTTQAAPTLAGSRAAIGLPASRNSPIFTGVRPQRGRWFSEE